MTKEQALTKIKESKQMIVVFSQMTKQPFVTCDPETFNDQVWVFANKEEMQEFAKKYTEEKILLIAYQIPQTKFFGFYTSLYSMGINEVVYVEDGERCPVELAQVVPAPDFSKYPEGQAPLMNPSLQLSGMYFMQEMRRPVPDGEKRQIKELQEELNANLVRAKYLVIEEPVDEKNVRIPYVKNEKGESYRPIFTDAYEYHKFAKGKKFRVYKVDFGKLNNLMLKDSSGFVVNPMGFNLLLQKNRQEKTLPEGGAV